MRKINKIKQSVRKISSLILMSILLVCLFSQAIFAADLISADSTRVTSVKDVDNSLEKAKESTPLPEGEFEVDSFFEIDRSRDSVVRASETVPGSSDDGSDIPVDPLGVISSESIILSNGWLETPINYGVGGSIIRSAALSSDGSKIVFITPYGSSSTLSVFSLDISRSSLAPVQIARNIVPFYPVVDRDASVIASPGILSSGQQVIFVSESGSSVMGYAYHENLDFNSVDISADGSTIICGAEPADEADPVEGVYKILIDRTRGSSRITDGRNPVISADGSKIAFTREVSGVYQLFRSTIYGAGIMQLTHGVKDVSNPSISGDGSKIAFSYSGEDGSEIYAINFDGSNLQRVTTSREVDGVSTRDIHSAITADGSKIVFKRGSGSEYGLMSVNSDGSNLRTIVNKEAISEYVLSDFHMDDTASKILVSLTIRGTHNKELMLLERSGSFLRFESASAMSGTVRVPINFETTDVLGSMNIILRYDPSVLTATDVSKGSLTVDALVESNIGDGTINLGIVDVDGFTGDGSVVYVEFEVGEAETGTESGLIIEELLGNIVDGTVSAITTENGVFRFEELKGDCNHDNIITSIDALIALQMSVGHIPAEPVADMNEDGVVTAYDALEILRIASETA